MKNLVALIAVFWLAVQSTFAQTRDSGTLYVNISGFHNDKGLVRLELFDDAKTFDKMEFSGHLGLRRASVPIVAGKAQIELSQLAFGKYALRYFHDEDKSEKFYTNFLGIPKVEYGFSNNAKSRFGPAKYKPSEFEFNKDGQTMDLTVGGG